MYFEWFQFLVHQFFSNNSWHRKVESVKYRFSTKSGKCTLYFWIFHKNEKNWKEFRLIHKFEQIRPFRMNLEIIKIQMNMEKWHFRMNQVVRNYEKVKIRLTLLNTTVTVITFQLATTHADVTRLVNSCTRALPWRQHGLYSTYCTELSI